VDFLIRSWTPRLILETGSTASVDAGSTDDALSSSFAFASILETLSSAHFSLRFLDKSEGKSSDESSEFKLTSAVDIKDWERVDTGSLLEVCANKKLDTVIALLLMDSGENPSTFLY
jgi:hypothetical protein